MERTWITNSDAATVTKLRASDGAVLGTFSVGLTPSGIVFDGKNMWITNYGSSNIMKLRLDGKILGTFPTGEEPLVPCFDGANIWVPSSDDNLVSKM
jgi:DNA-binding beta-propeller fold protein YncE